jgi:hypothetical protein
LVGSARGQHTERSAKPEALHVSSDPERDRIAVVHVGEPKEIVATPHRGATDR